MSEPEREREPDDDRDDGPDRDDPEAPDADSAEQYRSVRDDSPRRPVVGFEVDEYDAVEQSQVVPDEDDDRR